MIDDFEAIAFAGIEENNRHILWVRHRHTGNDRVELHFLAPHVEASTARAFNIAPLAGKDCFIPGKGSGI